MDRADKETNRVEEEDTKLLCRVIQTNSNYCTMSQTSTIDSGTRSSSKSKKLAFTLLNNLQRPKTSQSQMTLMMEW